MRGHMNVKKTKVCVWVPNYTVSKPHLRVTATLDFAFY